MLGLHFLKLIAKFLNGKLKLNAQKDLMKSHLNKHFNDIRNLTLEYNTIKDKLQGDIGSIFTDIMLKSISKSHKEELESFRIKKRQSFNLTK